MIVGLLLRLFLGGIYEGSRVDGVVCTVGCFGRISFGTNV
jgi:hypothetical protein